METFKMPFNDSLDFAPSIEKLQVQAKSGPFHVILSGYLRSSKTFELYSALEKREGLPSRLIPFELKTDAMGQFGAKLEGLFRLLRDEKNFRSIMVSDPFKKLVGPLVDEISERASQCGAVNVVVKSNGDRIIGDNFDGIAFRAGAIEECGVNFESKKMLFFGCGGVSSAVSTQLASNLSHIGLVDLKVDDANCLREILSAVNPKVKVQVLPSKLRDFLDYDYIYNGTGLGKFDQRSPIFSDDLFNSHGIAFDANYTPAITPFLKELGIRGFRCINGLSHMLMCTSMHLSAVCDESVPYETVRSAYALISSTD